MASSSTSSVQKSFKYDVFLSFRGEDTRRSFVDHLYDAFKRENIDIYKDDKNLEKGKKISNEFIQAIEESRFHIIVFSKNYASSSWCLDELVKIMKCQRTQTEQTVYPIFYDVEPTHVRKQSGEFGEVFAKHEKDEAAKKWREALVEATSFSGWDLRTIVDGHEAEFIKVVVKDISSKLPAISSTDEKLIGMRTRVNGVVSYLNAFPDEFCMIGIWGMGGSGKTTLARAVFDQICNEFEGSSFVENVRESSKPLVLGLKSLQQQVLRDVLKRQDITVNGVLEGKKEMKKKMSRIKVLVVLDDVDHIDQLKALAGEPNWFKPGSKIIITTREKQVLVAHKVNIHDVKLLTNEEAICLLSRCAFGTESPIQGYEELCGELVGYAAGLPLTITVLGSSLFEANEHVWIDTLKKLKKIPLHETLQKLELSYMGLDTDCREIFLDVACILKGWNDAEAIRVLESRGFHAICGLDILKGKSLITISHDNNLGMHDHLQEMGRHIVRPLHPDDPNKHSRLWIKKEIKDILVNNRGTEATQCIKLNLSLSSDINPEIVMKGLGDMGKLRFLLVRSYDFNIRESDEASQFPNSLQYLEWQRYPFRSLPKKFQASNLVVLQMFDSQIVQLWEGGERKVLDKLQFLQLSGSKLRTLDLGLTPNLETLDLHRCYDLVQLDIPVGCRKLKSLKLSGSKLSTLNLRPTLNIQTLNLECADLVELSMSHKCPQLKTLNLDGCTGLVKFDMPRECPQLITLDLEGCKNLVKLHMPSECPQLKTLYLNGCDDLLELHMPHECPQLETLNLKGCKELVELDMPREYPKLKSLNMICPKLRSLNLDDLILPRLKYLTLVHFKSRTLELTLNLKTLILECCFLVELYIPDRDVKVESLDIRRCLELETLDLERTPYLKSLRLKKKPQGILRFTEFRIVDMDGLLPVLHLTTESVDIWPLHPSDYFLKFQFDCSNREELPSLIGNVEKLILVGVSCACIELQVFFGSICGLQHLTKLKLKGLFHIEIKHLSNSICMFKHLKILKRKYSKLLEKLEEDLDQLQCREELFLVFTKIKHLPDSICMFKYVKILKLKDCKLLEKLPEDLDRLQCLEDLTLEFTKITHLPDGICMLKHLKYLKLIKCELLEKLPEDRGRLECLEELDTRGTCINNLPPSILLLEGLQSVQSEEETPTITTTIITTSTGGCCTVL